MKAALAACALVALTSCSDDNRAKRAGAELAAGLVNALEASSGNATPRLCAAWPQGNVATSARFELEGATATVAGERLRVEIAGDKKTAVSLVAVADARASETAIARTKSVASQLPASTRVVIAVGGMGRSQPQLVAALAPLVSPRWVLVAMPGDRESVPALRAAVAALARRGAVVDGAAVRSISAGELLAITLPGVAGDAGLAAGAEGCVHREVDIKTAAEALAAHAGARVMLSYAAPRQRGDRGSDLIDGVHAGEPALAPLLAGSRAHLLLHGQIELGPDAVESGTIEGDESGAALAIGALERSPALLGMGGSSFAGVVVTATKSGIRWQRLRP